MKQVKKAFKYRIYPNDLQKEMFAKTFGCARKIWNLMLDDRIHSYKQYQVDATPIKETTPAMYKQDYPYLKEVDSLAQAITDAGWAKFLALLKYKAFWYGKSIKEVEPYYPSTQICHVCGSKESKKALHIREWKCSSCHSYHDRDINAVINIHQHGLAI